MQITWRERLFKSVPSGLGDPASRGHRPSPPVPPPLFKYLSLFSFLPKDGHNPLTLIFSFLATRRRCFFFRGGSAGWERGQGEVCIVEE